MIYYGGSLIPHMEVQPVFLGNAWNSSTDRPNVAWLDNYLNFLVGSQYMEGLTRAGYDVGTGTTSPSVVAPLALGKQITGLQIRADLQKMITNGTVQAPDPDRVYVIFVGKGTLVGARDGENSANTFYAFHTVFGGTNASGQKTNLFVAVIPYQDAPSRVVFGPNTMRDSTTFATAHELAEVATDPDLNGWRYRDGEEVCDLANYAKATLSDGAGDSYVVANYVDQNLKVYSLTGWTNLLATTTTLSASASTITGGHEVTFTITVVPASGTGSISGTIDLLEGNKKIGTVTLQLIDGVETATIRTTLLGAGTHVIDAFFAGDSDYLGGFSDPLKLQVT
jgi:hypothetical protein